MKTYVYLAVLLVTIRSTATARGQSRSSSPSARIPSCTENLSTVAVPSAPHGLFAIMFPGASRLNARAHDVLLHNPVVCGANFYIVWSEVDRGPRANPRYDWSRVDEQIAPWVAAGKQINFIVWAAAYNRGLRATPDWAVAKADRVSCPNFDDVPVFWDRTFMSNYQQFMSAVVQKYGGNSAVGYIRFGLGLGGETFPPCMFAMKNRGFSPETWRKYTLDMLDYEASLKSPKLLMVGINSFGNPKNLEYPAAVARRAIENGIALGSQALSIEDQRASQGGQPCAVDWCRIFQEAAGKVPLELQPLKHTNPDRNGPIGSLADIMPFALRMKVQIFELYLQDWLVAYDPGDPNYPRYHQEYQQALEAAAKVVGGGK